MTDEEIFARHPSVARSGSEPLCRCDVALAAVADATLHGLATVSLEGFKRLERGRLPRLIADFSDLRGACWTRTVARCRDEARRFPRTAADRSLVFSVVLLSEAEWSPERAPHEGTQRL